MNKLDPGECSEFSAIDAGDLLRERSLVTLVSLVSERLVASSIAFVDYRFKHAIRVQRQG